MRKIIVRVAIMMIILLGMLSIKSNAASLEKTAEANGVMLSITADNGQVKSLSATFQIEGEVTLDTFKWADNLENVLKDYRYNKLENKLTIYITSGTGESLANEGRIILGTINVSGNETKSYKINLTNANLVTSNYRSLGEEVSDNPDLSFEYIQNEETRQSFDMELEASKNILNPGDEFEVKVKVTNFQNITELLVAGGQLEYNNEILELVEVANVDNENLEGNNIYFNETNFKFISDKKLVENETLINVKLRVKQGIVVPKETYFKIKSVDGSAANGDVYPKDESIVLQIEEAKVEEGISSDKYIVEEDIITNISPNTKVSEFKANIKTEQNIVVKDKNNNTLGEDELVGTGMILSVGNNKIYTLVVRGDIDGNGKLKTNDIALFKLHYIKSKVLQGVALKAADFDMNNNITTNDLAQMKLFYIKATTLD